MAVLFTNQAIDTRGFDYIEELFNNGTFVADRATRFTVVDTGFPDAELRFDGEGFVFGDDTIPDAGTITRVRARYEGETVWDVQELNITVQEFNDLLDQGWQTLVASVLGGNDEINGSAENDVLDGWGGNDVLKGSLGDDLYIVGDAGDRIAEKADEGYDTAWASADYKLNAHVERGRLTGTEDIDIEGNAANNRLIGNSGDNVINGNRGNDLLTGNGGADHFLFDLKAGKANVDRITDFTVGEDKIVLDETVFGQLDAGTLDPELFKDIGVAGAKVDRDDRIIYNSDTGQLFYDRDGRGGEARLTFAVLNNEAPITAADFLVV